MTNKVSFIIQFKDKFSRTAKAATRQLGGIKKESLAASSGIKKLGASIKRVTFTKLENGAKRANDRLKELGKRGENLRKIGKNIAAAGAVATAAVTVPAILLGKSLVNAASDAKETSSKFDTVFSSVKKSANEAAGAFATGFGVGSTTAKKLIGDTGDLLVGLGNSEAGALKMSTQLVELAADLASFQNLSGGAADAADRLTKGLTGETESLKALGIIIRQDTKEFRTLVKRTMRSERVSLQLARSIVILKEATKQSQKAIGDISRTWEDYANIARRVTEKNTELKETFGKHLIPLAKKLGKGLEAVANWLIQLSPVTQKFILAVIGLTAVLGPLLVLVGGIAIAIGFISSTVAIAIGALGGLIVVGALVIANWKKVKKVFNNVIDFVAATRAFTAIKAMWASFAGQIFGIADSIGDAFTALFEGRFLDSIKFAVNAGVRLLNTLLTPLSFVSKLVEDGAVQLPEFNVKTPQVPNIPNITNINTPQAPSAPVSNINGSLNGQITVSATKGTEVKSTKLTSKSSGLNVGLNMRAANG